MNKRKANATVLWRKLHELRDFFKDKVKWELGKGDMVLAVNQPWFHDWDKQVKRWTTQENNLLVAELWDEAMNRWRQELLIKLFGTTMAQQIAASVKPPSSSTMLPDILIWQIVSTVRILPKEDIRDNGSN